MPKIAQYDAPIEGFRTSDKGSSAMAELGHTARVYSAQTAAAIKATGESLNQGLHDLGRGVSDMEAKAKQAKELEEISNLNAASEDLQFQQRREYNEFANNTDLNDLDAVKEFGNRQDAAWRALSGNVTTQKGKAHLEVLRHQQRMHNLSTLGADQATQTATTIERNRNTRWMAATADMVNDPAPANVAAILERQRMKTEIELSTANVNVKTKEAIVNHENAQLNKVLTEAAASFIRRGGDPEQAYKYVAEKEEGNPYYGRVDLLKLRGLTDAEINRRETKAVTDERRVEHDARTQIDASQGQILLDSIRADGKVVVPEGALDRFKDTFDKNPGLVKYVKPGEITSFINNIRHIANAPDDYNLTPNQDTMNRISEGLAAGTITLPEIVKARRDGEIGNQFMKSSVAELKQQNSALQTPEFKAALTAAKSDLVQPFLKNMPINDSVGKENYSNFMQNFMPAWRQRVAEGKNEPNDLNVKDPDSFISQHMAPFKRTFQEQQKDMMDALKGGQQKQSINQVNPAATNKQPVSAMELAESQIGLKEVQDRSALTAFFQAAGGNAAKIDPATTPWCAAWASSILKVSGIDAPNTATAREFLTRGVPIELPSAKKGDIVVFARGNSPTQGHVGFYAGPGETPGTIKLLAGNQGGRVAVVERSTEGILGIRRYEKKDIVGVTPPGGPIAPPNVQETPKLHPSLQGDAGNMAYSPSKGLWFNTKTGMSYDPKNGKPTGPEVPRSE